MSIRMQTVLAIAAAMGITAAASADIVVGQPFLIGDEPMAVSLRFTGSHAGWDGVLRLDGDSAPDHVDVPLFFNHDSPIGTEINLGLFQPGQRIDFIYDVLTGHVNSFRTDTPVGLMQFSWEQLDPNTCRVGVEDIALPGGDHDYNDMTFEIHTLAVPAPAATAGALGLLGAATTRRRR